jgi:hypothetical protein
MQLVQQRGDEVSAIVLHNRSGVEVGELNKLMKQPEQVQQDNDEDRHAC